MSVSWETPKTYLLNNKQMIKLNLIIIIQGKHHYHLLFPEKTETEYN